MQSATNSCAKPRPKTLSARSCRRTLNSANTLLAGQNISDYLHPMRSKSYTIFAFVSALRILLLLALVVALNTSHLGMSSPAHGMSMTTADAGQTQDQADHTGHRPSKMSDSLCATLCLGTDRLVGGVAVGRVEGFVVATLLAEIDNAWTPQIPDPALRPPDTLQLT